MNKHKRFVLICLYLVSMASIISHAHQDKEDKNIASLIQQLGHTEEDVQDSARQSLAEIGAPAVPALIEALGDSNHKYRRKVSSALAQIGMPAMSALIAALDHENVVVRREVVSLLRTLKNKIPSNHKDFKIIVRAIVKALKDDESGVRAEAMECFLGKFVTELPPKLAAEVISGLVQSLYYGSPFFDGITAGLVLNSIGNRGRAVLTDALHSSSWPLRFGAAFAYGYMYDFTHSSRAMLLRDHINPFPKAVVPILAEGLTHPDWKTQEDAMTVLSIISNFDPVRFAEIAKAIDEAKKALEALPPFGIISQTVRDRQRFRDPDALDSLNTDGITFKFNRSIHRDWTLTIKPVDGEPLGWNIEKSSHSVTITPPEGKELVKGQRYIIQLRDVRDILSNQIDAEIEFSTVVPLFRLAH